MLTSDLVKQLSFMLKRQTGHEDVIADFSYVGGGSINDCGRFNYAGRKWFVKWNLRDKYRGMFTAEKKGLELLQTTGNIGLPTLLDEGETEKYAFLLMSYVQQTSTDKDFWIRFGQQLAALHGNSADSFGLDHHNFIGSLPQRNDQRQSWSVFFAEMRLFPQARLAVTNRNVPHTLISKTEKLSAKLEQLFPNERPALLHGDLWSGNFLCNSDRNPVLIDPAVYFGHREMDLAMTRLFGGFSPIFYDAYNSCFPLEYGWQERTDLCNLYPLLVHVNLFGGGYLTQVEQILRRYL